MALVTRRRRVGLWTTALLATFAVGYAVVVFLPRQRALSKKHRQLIERQRFIVAGERLRPALRTASQELQQLRDVCRSWKPLDTLASRLPTYFARLTEAASQRGLTVRQLTPGDPNQLKTLQRQPLALTVEGAFHDIFAYLADVDQMPEFAWIDALEIEPEERDSTTVRCRMRLVVFTGFSGGKEKTE